MHENRIPANGMNSKCALFEMCHSPFSWVRWHGGEKKAMWKITKSGHKLAELLHAGSAIFADIPKSVAWHIPRCGLFMRTERGTDCISAREMFNQNDLWKKFRSPGQSNKFIVPFCIVSFGLAQPHVIHTAYWINIVTFENILLFSICIDTNLFDILCRCMSSFDGDCFNSVWLALELILQFGIAFVIEKAISCCWPNEMPRIWQVKKDFSVPSKESFWIFWFLNHKTTFFFLDTTKPAHCQRITSLIFPKKSQRLASTSPRLALNETPKRKSFVAMSQRSE